MPHILFRSRWVAIVWVVGVLLAISHFFGGNSPLDGLAERVKARKAQVEQPVQNPPVVVPAPPPRIIVKEVEDPEELEHYRELAESTSEDPTAAERYVVIDKATAMEAVNSRSERE